MSDVQAQQTRQARRELVRGILARQGIGLPEPSAIPVRADRTQAPLSFEQRRIWFLCQQQPLSSFYNTPLVLKLSGSLNVEALHNALSHLVARHDILRTTFSVIEGEPRQIISQSHEPALPICDFRALPQSDRRVEALAYAETAVSMPFDLVAGPLFRSQLLRLEDSEWWLLLLTHHLIFDGWSIYILGSELDRAYRTAGTPMQTEPSSLAIQYGDFSEWQRSLEFEDLVADQLPFWMERLRDAPRLTTLATDRPRPSAQSYRGATHTFSVPPRIMRGADELSAALGIGRFALLVAALSTVIHRYTNQSDLILSSGVAGRKRREFEALIGCFINIVLLRIRFAEAPTFRMLLTQIQQTISEALQNQDVPFDRVVNALRQPRDQSHAPLAQVMIVYHNAMPEFTLGTDLDVETVHLDRHAAQYDLLLHLRPVGDELLCHLEYSTDLFDPRTMERFADAFVNLVSTAIAAPDCAIADLAVLPPREAERIAAFNATARSYPDTACIHELIETTAARAGCNPAVIGPDGMATYAETLSIADRLARELQGMHAGPGSLVGLCVERGLDLVVGMLGIAMAGAGYVPLDPTYPAARLLGMIKDARISHIVTSERTRGLLAWECPSLCVADVRHLLVGSELRRSSATASDMLYTIFTSGSTGRPKGVMLDHRGRVNNFWDFNTRFSVGKDDRLLAVSSMSFDMCAYDVFGMLMAGGTVVFPDTSTVVNPGHWAETIRNHNITIWHSAPALLEVYLDCVAERPELRPKSLRLVLLGGDWIPVGLPDRIRQIAGSHVQVVSLGGATEASMDSTIFEVTETCKDWTSIPYGVPMANQSAYVLDDALRPVAVGVPGELYLGGIGLAWGYCGRPDLTAERFVPNTCSDSGGARIYRTGDLARWTNAGTLELLGRIDHQVKLNGVRVELAEVETVFKRLPGVRGAAARLCTDETGVRRLICYYETDGSSPEPDDLRRSLRGDLPDFMIPHDCVQLAAIPLSPNGKVDRRALPEHYAKRQVQTEALRNPVTILERELHAAWSEALGHGCFGVTDSFFDVGGDSFQVIRALNRLPRPMSIAEFLSAPTICEQAQLLSDGNRAHHAMLFPLRRRAPVHRVTLLCVPYGGGSAICYRKMAECLPAQILPVAITLPGHDICDTRQDLIPVQTLAASCVSEVLEGVDGDLAIYGHCAGSVLAVAMALQLADAGRPPLAVFLGGVLPPRPEQAGEAPVWNSDKDILHFIQTLGGIDETADPAQIGFLIRAFRNDSQAAADYVATTFASHPPHLDCPLIVAVGDKDPLTRDHAGTWNQWYRFADDVHPEIINGGGHYFVQTHARECGEIVSKYLL
jgi:amino acid adenylation domain-containing protein